jgi:hypothetical protein
MNKGKHRVFRRPLKQIVNDFGSSGDGSFHRPPDSRHKAVANVLRRLPEDAYNELKDRQHQFSWFIPELNCGGEVTTFPCRKPRKGRRFGAATVLYLSPELERLSMDVIIANTAHEVAHIVLDHDDPTRKQKGKESEARQTVIVWGFGKEERAAACVYYNPGRKQLMRR